MNSRQTPPKPDMNEFKGKNVRYMKPRSVGDKDMSSMKREKVTKND